MSSDVASFGLASLCLGGNVCATAAATTHHKADRGRAGRVMMMIMTMTTNDDDRPRTRRTGWRFRRRGPAWAKLWTGCFVYSLKALRCGLRAPGALGARLVACKLFSARAAELRTGGWACTRGVRNSEGRVVDQHGGSSLVFIPICQAWVFFPPSVRRRFFSPARAKMAIWALYFCLQTVFFLAPKPYFDEKTGFCAGLYAARAFLGN